jgi:hypothetical protein
VTTNLADDAAFTSDLFRITPASEAAFVHFVSLVLSLLGSDRFPTLLGIVTHPPRVVL